MPTPYRLKTNREMKQINIYLPPKDMLFAVIAGLTIGCLVADWIIN